MKAVEIELPIGGMTCAACARAVERQLGGTEGVENAGVNFATRTALVRFDPGRTRLESLIAAVEDIGYDVPIDAPEIAEQAQLRDLRLRLIIGAACAVPVVILGMMESAPWIQFVFTLPVIGYSALPFYRDAWAAGRHRTANMNTLIALGTGAAFLYSIWTLFAGGASYFEAAAVIVVFVLLGRMLESRARGRASSAIRRLMQLQPAVPVQEGDVITVRPGERVPADGVVREGATEIDESMLTGESLPVAVSAGSAVHCGTLNGTGAFTFAATRVGKDTALARIIDLVKKAQGSKAPIARLADVVSGYFTFAVLAAAALTFLGWIFFASAGTALVNAVAVLIVACPCAMGLATPTAIMAGTGRGAARGILIKSGEVLERAARVDTVILDKTGTVTTGKLRVVRVTPSEGFSTENVLALAAAVEQWSEHPVARAVVREAQHLQLPASSGFRATPGRGAAAVVDGRNVFVGMSDAGSIAVEVDGDRAGTIEIADEPKKESPGAIARLQSMGLEVWMITGDHARVAGEVAHASGIDPSRVIAQVLPQDKEREVARLQAEGKRVAMVGDGINDAPALARADCGIAIGTGTDVAIETAGLILMRGDLNGVPEALGLARQTLRVIRQNLFWAFGYNALAIPVAAGVFYHWTGWTLSPMIASAAMALSSVSVVTNSLRLSALRLSAVRPD
jgi:Cu+-exporting ATPase